jgi:hypothetical protein
VQGVCPLKVTREKGGDSFGELAVVKCAVIASRAFVRMREHEKRLKKQSMVV